jgi:predicted membrane protein
MESANTNESNTEKQPWHVREPKGSRSGRIFTGLIILTIGTIFLAKQMGVFFPHWLISWPMILIAVGLYVGFRHSFRGPVWIILIVLGSFFLIDLIDHSFDFGRYIFPVVLIAVGLMIIFRPKKKHVEPVISWDSGSSQTAAGPEDVMDSVTIFGGLKKKIISKTFRGGELTTIFGGTELDLTKADVPGPIELELTQVFGGTKLIVPPHWRIHSDDLVSIFGGLDDKRPMTADLNLDQTKVLILKGTVIFGGIDIKSY